MTIQLNYLPDVDAYALVIGDVHFPYMTKEECLVLAHNVSATPPQPQWPLQLKPKPEDGGPYTVSVQHADEHLCLSWQQGRSPPANIKLSTRDRILFASVLLEVQNF